MRSISCCAALESDAERSTAMLGGAARLSSTTCTAEVPLLRERSVMEPQFSRLNG